MATSIKKCALLLSCSKLNFLKRTTAACQYQLVQSLSSGINYKSRWANTSDSSMIVCYHPEQEFPYEHTKPIIRQGPVVPDMQSAESILKSKLQFDHYGMEKRGPSITDLSKTFYTTKHRWYPLGIRRRNRKNPNPPRDRDYL